MNAFFVSIPHAGEKIPDLCPWLKGLPEPILMADVDRYVDLLYQPSLKNLSLPMVTTEWHRYAADLNRFPSDVDSQSVVSHANSAGAFTRGFHWVKTFEGAALMNAPMSMEDHKKLVQLIYDPFHAAIQSLCARLRSEGAQKIYHIDAHSMPSLGTSEHRDPGERRADVVVSDVHGKSSDPAFVDLVISSYVRAGFKVAYNWPYFGGRLTERYGKPLDQHHTVQVELNRALYMDEVTKKKKLPEFDKVILMIEQALARVVAGLE